MNYKEKQDYRVILPKGGGNVWRETVSFEPTAVLLSAQAAECASVVLLGAANRVIPAVGRQNPDRSVLYPFPMLDTVSIEVHFVNKTNRGQQISFLLVGESEPEPKVDPEPAPETKRNDAPRLEPSETERQIAAAFDIDPGRLAIIVDNVARKYRLARAELADAAFAELVSGSALVTDEWRAKMSEMAKRVGLNVGEFQASHALVDVARRTSEASEFRELRASGEGAAAMPAEVHSVDGAVEPQTMGRLIEVSKMFGISPDAMKQIVKSICDLRGMATPDQVLAQLTRCACMILRTYHQDLIEIGKLKVEAPDDMDPELARIQCVASSSVDWICRAIQRGEL